MTLIVTNNTDNEFLLEYNGNDDIRLIPVLEPMSKDVKIADILSTENNITIIFKYHGEITIDYNVNNRTIDIKGAYDKKNGKDKGNSSDVQITYNISKRGNHWIYLHISTYNDKQSYGDKLDKLGIKHDGISFSKDNIITTTNNDKNLAIQDLDKFINEIANNNNIPDKHVLIITLYGMRKKLERDLIENIICYIRIPSYICIQEINKDQVDVTSYVKEKDKIRDFVVRKFNDAFKNKLWKDVTHGFTTELIYNYEGEEKRIVTCTVVGA